MATPVLGAILATLVVLGAPPSPAAAENPEFTTFTDPNVTFPYGIVEGPDGNVWFGSGANRIGKITPGGTITTYPAGSGTATDLAVGPDGNLWFTDFNNDRIGRITTAGAITTFTDPLGNVNGPEYITAGPGGLWFTTRNGHPLGRITTAGVISTFTDANISSPNGITLGPDGNVWFTSLFNDRIGKITSAGVITTYTSSAVHSPAGLVAGPDGNLWFVNSGTAAGQGGNGTVNRISTTGAITAVTATGMQPLVIDVGADGDLWIAGCGGDRRVRVTTAGVLTTFHDPLNDSVCIRGITSAADGSMWFAKNQAGNTLTRLRVLPDAPPSAPRNLAFSYTGTSGEAHLTWDAPASTGGSPIDNYNITVDGGSVTTLPGSARSYDVLGLNRGQHYNIEITATNAIGDSPAASVDVLGADTPAAPENLTAAPGNGQVALDWDPPADDGGQPITAYRILVNPGGAAPTVPASTTTYTATGLTNGQQYSFTIQAITDVGYGDGAFTTATPSNVTPPSAPTGLTATGGDQQVGLNWSPPTSDGGSPVLHYVVRQDGQQVAQVDAPTTARVVSGLTNGSTHTFTVNAVNAAGEGPAVTASSVKVGTVPSAPTGLTATPGNGQVLLNWTAPAATGGWPVTAFRVYRNGALAQTITAPTSSATVTGLTNGQSSNFEVAAVNAIGEGGKAGPISSTPRAVPTVPQSVQVVEGNRQLTITWGAPASDGGSTVTAYRFFVNGAQVAEVAASPRSFNPTNLVNGQTYSLQMAAVNAAGEGPKTAVFSGTPGTTPSAPQNLTATPGDGQVALSWSAPADNGGRTVTGYRFFRDGAQLAEFSAPMTSMVFGVPNGETHSFEVAAINAFGVGTHAGPVTVTARTAPAVPQNVQVVEGNHQLTFTWGAPASDGGSTVTAYRFFSGGTQVAEVPATPRQLVATNLTNGQTYSLQMAAVNAAGEGPKTAVFSGTPGTTPSAPQGLTATPGNAQVALSWTAPADNGGRAVTAYRVYRNGAQIAIVNASTTSFVVGGLTNGQSSSFEVAAVNTFGEGTHTGATTATPRTVPGAPQSLAASPKPAGDVLLTWAAPSSDGGAAVEHYRVFRGGTQVAELGPSATTFTDTGRTVGQTYSYEVAATNAVGEGAHAGPVPIVAATVPAAPRNLRVEPRDGNVVLTWDAPADNGGRAITDYEILVDGQVDGYASNPLLRSYAVAPLTNGRTYRFEVGARNVVGRGPTAVADDFPELQTTITVSLSGDNQARVGGIIHTTATVTNTGTRAANDLVVTGSLTTCAAPGASPLAPGAHVDVPCTRTALAGDVTSVPATVSADAHNAAPVDSNARRTWVFPASGYTDMTQALFQPAGDWARYHGLTPVNLQSTAFYTRAQAVRLLWQLMGSPTGFGAHRFVDIPAGVNYLDAVKWGRARGILDLPANREFNPAELLTRQALVVWLHRMSGLQTGAPTAGYTDTAGLSATVQRAVNWAHARGIVHEANGNKFKPTVTPARQSALYMIWRLASTRPAWNNPPDGLPASAVFVCCEPGESPG